MARVADLSQSSGRGEATISGYTHSNVFATTNNAEVVGSSGSASAGDRFAVYPTTCAAAPCAPTWSLSLPADTAINRAVVANGVIYADVFAIDPSTLVTAETLVAYPLDCSDGCQPLLTLPVDDGLVEEVVAGPIVSNGQVLYGTTKGNVAALRPERLRWRGRR